MFPLKVDNFKTTYWYSLHCVQQEFKEQFSEFLRTAITHNTIWNVRSCYL